MKKPLARGGFARFGVAASLLALCLFAAAPAAFALTLVTAPEPGASDTPQFPIPDRPGPPDIPAPEPEPIGVEIVTTPGEKDSAGFMVLKMPASYLATPAAVHVFYDMSETPLRAPASGGKIREDYAGVRLFVPAAWFDGSGLKSLAIRATDRSEADTKGYHIVLNDRILSSGAGVKTGLFDARGEEVRVEITANREAGLTFGLFQGDRAVDFSNARHPAVVGFLSRTPDGTDVPLDLRYAVARVAPGASETVLMPRSRASDTVLIAKADVPGRYITVLSDAADFTDTKGHWAAASVDFVARRGLIAGYGNGEFGPKDVLTRAHFMTILTRLFDPGKVSDGSGAAPAPADEAGVPAWAKTAVTGAIAGGYVPNFKSGDRFEPNAPITRQDMFLYTYAAMQRYGLIPPVFTLEWRIFPDWDDTAADAGNAIQNLAKLGLVNGDAGGRLNPLDGCTRAEAAQFLYNVMMYDGTV